jgi:hypothetical protein
MADIAEKTVTVTAELPQSVFDELLELAKKSGVSANTVLQQAIEAGLFFSEKQRQGSQVLIEYPDKTIKRVIVNR